MNKHSPFQSGRRRLLVASLIAPVVGLVPDLLRAGWSPQAGSEEGSADRLAWLAVQDPESGNWRRRSLAPSSAFSSGDIRLRLRGPWWLGQPDRAIHLRLSVRYAALPNQVFRIDQAARDGGVLLHGSPDALQAVEIQAEEGSAVPVTRCRLIDIWHRRLQPGRYLILADPGGTGQRPNWSRIDSSSRADGCPDCVPDRRHDSLVAVRLDVEPV